MNALNVMPYGRTNRRNRRKPSRPRLHRRRVVLEQLEGRQLLAANPLINEFVANHIGSDTDEYVEIVDLPGEDLSAFSVLVVDGDGGAAGDVIAVLPVGSLNAGGFAYAGNPPANPDPDGSGPGIAGIGLQNGTQSLLLVEGFTGLVDDDLDTDNDGVLDSTPWTQLADDVAVSDGDAGDQTYSSSVLTPATMNDGITFSIGGASRIGNGTDTDSSADWVRNDFGGDGLISFGGETFTAGTGIAINTPLTTNFVRDPFSPELTTSETNDTTEVSESGITDTFEIALRTNPSQDVTVTVTPDSQLDLGAGPGSAITLIFGNKLPQVVTVAASDDAIVEAATHAGLISISTSSGDSDYNNRSASVSASIADNDTPAVPTFINEFVVNHSGADIDEFVEVVSQPNAILSSLTLLNIDGDFAGGGVGEILHAEALSTADPSGFLVIHPTTEVFDSPNLVLVEGFSGALGVDVDVDDDGVFDWDQSPVPTNGLAAAPWTSVRDAVSAPDTNDATYGFVELSPATLSDGNTFDVGGASRIPGAIGATTSASEWLRNDFSGQGLPNYDPLAAPPSTPGTALNTPGSTNDVISGLLVEESDDSTAVTEGGSSDSLTLSLAGIVPTDNVIVTITPDGQLNLGAGAGVAITETFVAPATGPITISVDAFDDTNVEGPHSGTIMFTVSSSDSNYDGGTAPDVTVTITDNEVGGETPQIIINEIMKNPAQVSDTNGEYVELYNAGTSTVDINGWTLSDEDSDSHVIDNGSPLNIAPGEYLILGRNASSADNGGVTVDYQYTDFFLANGADEVVLSTDTGAVIDQVNYNDADFPDDNGVSLELKPAILMNPNAAADNDAGENWQSSTTALGADFGTPGAINSGDGDSVPPTVTDVVVAGVGGTFAWQTPFIDAVDDAFADVEDGGIQGAGNGLGYSVLGTTRTVPWYNVNTIYIQFSEDVNVSSADLFGVAVADYAGDFSVNTVGSLTTITMATPFGLPETDPGAPTTGIDKLLLRLQSAAVTDLAGNQLDGDNTGGQADFTQRIDVLPGDATGDGGVNTFDVGLTNLRGFTSSVQPSNGTNFEYSGFFDITADGTINTFDVGLTNFQGFDALPSGDPLASPGSSSLVSDDDDDWAGLVDQAFGDSGLF